MGVRYRIAVRGNGESSARSVIEAGAHRFAIDEPKDRHGTDEGPSPLEYLMGAFAGCTNVISSRIAEEMGIIWKNGLIEVEGELDGGVLQGHDVPVAFPKLTVNVHVRSDASPEQASQLKQELARRCPVSVLFRQAGTEVIENWKVEPI